MIKHYQRQLSDKQNQLAFQLAKGSISLKNKELQAMSDVEQSQIFDLSYDYLRQIMESDQEEEIFKQQQEIAYSVLLARSQIEQPFSLSRVPVPKIRDDQGHGTTRVSISAGTYDQQAFWDFHYRGTYHSLTDPPEGYMIGSELSFFDFQFRLLNSTEKDDRISLHRLDYIRILSLPERDTFFQPYSWKIKISTDEDWIDTSHRAYIHSVTGGAGVSYGNEIGRVFGLLQAKLQLAPAFSKGFGLQGGLEVGAYLISSFGQSLFQTSNFSRLAGNEQKIGEVSFKHAFNLIRETSLELSLLHHYYPERNDQEYGLSIHSYY